mgnify:CR=1 FL=1
MILLKGQDKPVLSEALISQEDNRGYRILNEALGRIALKLSEEDVVEVYCNSTDPYVWVEYAGKGRNRTDILISVDDRRKIIQTVATFSNTIANGKNPIITSELPKYGYRFEGSMPDVSLLPSFNIRKPAGVVFTLDDYVERNIMTDKQKEIIKLAVESRRNILIGGGTGSGKTTLCNAILAEMSRLGSRLIILEDTRELQCTAQDFETFRTTDDVSMTKLLKTTLRRRPDRIIVGEVRDGAAYDLLKAWNTGHPGGVSTTHANSALDTLERIANLSMETNHGSAVPPGNVINKLIASAINIVVFIDRSSETVAGKVVHGRKVKEVVYVSGYDFLKDSFEFENDEEKILSILRMM